MNRLGEMSERVKLLIAGAAESTFRRCPCPFLPDADSRALHREGVGLRDGPPVNDLLPVSSTRL
jgi:hypothetical protein